MSPTEAEVSDVVVILDRAWEGRTDEACRLLEGAGLRSTQVVSDEGAVEGTIDVSKVPAIRKLPCVRDVRTVFTYVAEERAAPGEPGATPAEPDPEADADSG